MAQGPPLPARPPARPGSLWSGKKASGLEADPHPRPPRLSRGGPGSHPHFRSELSVGPSRASRTPGSALPGEAGAGRKRPARGPRPPSLEGAHGSGWAPDVPAPPPSITELSPRNVLQTRSPREEAPGRLRSPARPQRTPAPCEHGARAAPVPPSQPGPGTLLSLWTWAPARVPAFPPGALASSGSLAASVVVGRHRQIQAVLLEPREQAASPA